MRFDNLLKKQYYLLEQEGGENSPETPENPEVDPNKVKDAAKEMDDAGEQLNNQVQTVYKQTLKLFKRFFDMLDDELRTNPEQAKLPQDFTELIAKINQATLNPSPIDGLKSVEDSINEMGKNYEKTTQTV